MPTRRLTLIVNPRACGGRSLRILPDVHAVLDEAGAGYEVVHSRSLAHAAEVAGAVAARGEVVVAVGGDGMVGRLAGEVARHGGVFAVVPAGRGNDFARMLGIPFDAAAAARVAAAGEPRPIDVVEVNGRLVASSVYVGIDSVTNELANRMRLISGPLVYRVAALRTLLRWRPARYLVEVDGEAYDFAGYSVVVANNAYYGGGMKVAPAADVTDGLLEVTMMRDAPKRVFVRALRKVNDGSHVDLAEVATARGAVVTVAVDRPLPVYADGEPVGVNAPLTIRTLQGRLRVLLG